MAQKNWDAAAEMADQFSRKLPGEVAAWILAAQCSMQSGQLDRAADCLVNARQLAPEDVMLIWQQLKVWESLGRYDLAIPQAKKMLNLIHKESVQVRADVLQGLAVFLMAQHQFEQAELIFLKINQQQPNHSDVLLNLATIKQYRGEIKEAEMMGLSVLNQFPMFPDALYFLAHLNRKNDKNLVEKIKSALKQKQLHPQSESKLHFSLAKKLEDAGDFATSFEHRKKGTKLFRSTYAYDVDGDIDFIKHIKEAYSQKVMKHSNDSCVNDAPIFIVGLPRSGTTLLERIIGNHDEVISAGELIYFNRLMSFALQKKAKNEALSSQQMVSASIDLDFNELGKSYVNCAEASLDSKARFIDKHPINGLYLGLIHKALPNAKFIILDRQPMDMCYAVYKQLFAPGIYQYSYDLKEVAAYYQAHSELMDHWQNVMPDAVCRINYEDLVADTELTARCVLDFCNLSWQGACLDLGSNKQASATASASQVRGKVYSSSVGLWKNYKEELSDLKRYLTS